MVEPVWATTTGTSDREFWDHKCEFWDHKCESPDWLRLEGAPWRWEECEPPALSHGSRCIC